MATGQADGLGSCCICFVIPALFLFFFGPQRGRACFIGDLESHLGYRFVSPESGGYTPSFLFWGGYGWLLSFIHVTLHQLKNS